MSGSLKEAVLARQPLAGTTVTLPGAGIAELLAEPFDLIWIDLEHAALGPRDAQEIMIGAQAAGAYVLVRIPAEDHLLMTKMLDAGVDGVVLADVRQAATAEAAVRLTRHPPDGERGFGPRRLSLRRRTTEAPRATPSLWVQIESQQGRRNAGEIAAVDGVDAVVIGASDLSFAVGSPLDTGSQQMREAVSEIREAVSAAGTVFGLAGALDGDTAELAHGASILVLGTDARLCAGAVDSAARRMRDILNHDSQEMQLS
ncbi:MAG TPA: aldolase/citrate lyase family protein [Solirubrobacteraceae bacterium]|jgi:2-keto-3-deoxy-L-rhamnonate aldolase RhmA|nr:aldolase/citrate lyase family protein [Solirubrobacteraceae bacterium]